MLTIDEIVGEKDLVQLFRTIVRKGEVKFLNRQYIVKRIREFAPLSMEDLEGLYDEDILEELERNRRWSILRRLKRDRK
ncbi:uncharacterized protein Eint_071200 [Encephalitozoon intestinalis ATCC 50506]|uniref:Uncharacterized protein n=1 Tax=Encephalitozoon intestinalis (strain ATCC 50506) TaxID=876142 RepID=E0S848_ENCIT|nr:uncharacterized protein Eint_071200 [Encephalitozoon intestinalis ATCC 50506]ADM11883.2 hypothetical protein Eint_071200 [Encephalitozoon intestinalis ATCC 50506]UTX45639.1 hypothetical protein GPK93_07g12040 [Encephalitozoon intestinalis]